MTPPKQPQASYVPISTPDSHPIMIGIQLNPMMKAWDITVDIGNFKTKEDAESAAKMVRDALEKAIGARFGARVQ